MLTPELLKEALRTSHDECDTPEGCVHADAISGAAGEMKTAMAGIGLAALTAPNPLEFTIFVALHIGYRLRQLEEASDNGVLPSGKKVLVN